MKTFLTWQSDEYHSAEHCTVSSSARGYETTSVIRGSYEGDAFEANYTIITNKDWRTLSAKVELNRNHEKQSLLFENNGGDQWLFNSIPDERFNNCIDVDLPLTPFTNTLPIRRLKMNTGDAQLIKVIYIDVFGSIRAVQQKYTRLSASIYKYENVPNDFEAVITVDDLGFVVDYPGLFKRV
jgi:hypothetical protein